MREHLLAIEEQTGITPEELAHEPPNEAVLYLLDYFYQLSQARQSGMSANALLFSEILAWTKLMKIHLNAWEVEVIKHLDILWLNTQSEE